MKMFVGRFLFTQMTLGALLVGSALAVNHVPDGNYRGTGTWSDSKGRSGTAEVIYRQQYQPQTRTAIAYSHAILKSGNTVVKDYEASNIVYVFHANDDYKYDVTIPGLPQPIGSGLCVSDQCQTTLFVSATEVTTESVSFEQPNRLKRIGAVADSADGSSLLYRVTMHRTGH